MNAISRQSACSAVAMCLLVIFSCTKNQDSNPSPEEMPIPPSGPHYSVSPLPLDVLVDITPVGNNNKALLIGHTYWSVCYGHTGECYKGHYEIRAPGNGVIWTIEPGPDGGISIIGPPGLYTMFSHISPDPSLKVGERVKAGDVIAKMFYDHSFDFGVMNYGVMHQFVSQKRFPPIYIHAQSPLELFEEPLRSQLSAKVDTEHSPYGRLSFDVAGTAQGIWLEQGAPAGDEAMTVDYGHLHLYLGRLVQREKTRILTTATI